MPLDKPQLVKYTKSKKLDGLSLYEEEINAHLLTLTIKEKSTKEKLRIAKLRLNEVTMQICHLEDLKSELYCEHGRRFGGAPPKPDPKCPKQSNAPGESVAQNGPSTSTLSSDQETSKLTQGTK